jgi:hypothetical protein
LCFPAPGGKYTYQETAQGQSEPVEQVFEQVKEAVVFAAIADKVGGPFGTAGREHAGDTYEENGTACEEGYFFAGPFFFIYQVGNGDLEEGNGGRKGGKAEQQEKSAAQEATGQLLKSEAACLKRREVYWARKATTVSLVSADEAETFARIAGREVHSLPMSVRLPVDGWKPCKVNGARPVFVGGLDYKPNLDALLYYQEQIFAVVKAACRRAPMLDHVGNSPLDVRSKFAPAVVHFEGYVPDIVPRLSDASFFVAPMVSGTGIKTKVLEAMAVGLPVVATRHAVAGLRVEHKKHCFICERPADFAEAMQYLSNPELAAKLGVEARKYVQSNFSMDVLRQRWSAVIHQLGLSRRAKFA